jgi:hypothetical protein
MVVHTCKYSHFFFGVVGFEVLDPETLFVSSAEEDCTRHSIFLWRRGTEERGGLEETPAFSTYLTLYPDFIDALLQFGSTKMS